MRYLNNLLLILINVITCFPHFTAPFNIQSHSKMQCNQPSGGSKIPGGRSVWWLPFPMHRCNVGMLSLFYKYFNGACSKELVALIPRSRIWHSTHTSGTSVHSWRCLHVFKGGRFSNLFLCKTACTWNELPASVFPPLHLPRAALSNPFLQSLPCPTSQRCSTG